MTASNRLTALAIKSLGPGLHADGNGLYFRVSGDKRRWTFIYQWQGKRREMGLGTYKDTPLAKARELAANARRQIRDGIDPIRAKKRDLTAGVTFGEVAASFIKVRSTGWRNAKHRQQWTNSLRDYAHPLASKSVADITTADVFACLKDIWSTKPETASRVRMRIENVLDAAKAQGLRTGENPAAWKGNLAHLLGPRSKLSRGHHLALPYEQAPAFITNLRARTGVAAKALEFTILTAARTSETLGARWDEFDLEKAVWTVPAGRMKVGVQQRVPLSDPAMAILRELQGLGSDWVFPAADLSKRLSGAAMSAVLKRMNVAVTVHGFRSTFRDWAGEETSFAREVVEAALAHKVGDEVERAYRRGDALAKRRAVMEAWALRLSITDA